MHSSRSVNLWAKLILAAIAVAIGGCGHMPVMSMVRLARVPFDKTDPALLRAAVKLPRMLRPRTQGVVLRITVRLASGTEETHDLLLRENVDQADLVALRDEIDGATHIFTYRFDAAEAARFSALREALKQKQQAEGGRGGSLSIAVRADMCRTGELGGGPVLITTYLGTKETDGYVPLTRDVDLRSVTPGHDLVAAILPCA
jgi:hypothetical protein